MGNRLESEISIPPTKEEMASLDKRELKVKWLRDGLRDRIRDVEKFFRSWWFAQLTDLDGELLLERLRKESENDKRRS